MIIDTKGDIVSKGRNRIFNMEGSTPLAGTNMAHAEMEAFQLILQSAYEFEREHPREEEILSTWRKINEKSIEYGKELFNIQYFREAANDNKHIGQVYDEVMEGYMLYKQKEGNV